MGQKSVALANRDVTTRDSIVYCGHRKMLKVGWHRVYSHYVHEKSLQPYPCQKYVQTTLIFALMRPVFRVGKRQLMRSRQA